MHIGIDARELCGHPTGVGRYLSQLLREWTRVHDLRKSRHEFTLYVPADSGPRSTELLAGASMRYRTVPGSPGTWWEQVSLARAVAADRPDVFFAPAYTLPALLGCPSVLTIHDVSFLAHPEWFAPRERWRRAWLTRLSARRATLVLTVSEFSRQEIERRIGIAAGQVRVIRHGIARPGLEVPRHAIASGKPSDAIPGFAAREPLVLYVGSVLNRRRVPELIQAFAQVHRQVPDARLAIVGENRTYPHQDLASVCSALDITSAVDLRAYVDDGALADLYRRARVFAFLSEYEGFGLTPLEALASGIPLVVLDTPIAREVCGPAARFVGAGDVDGCAKALTALLTDAGSHADALRQGADVLARYSWPEAASATLDAIETAGRRR